MKMKFDNSNSSNSCASSLAQTNTVDSLLILQVFHEKKQQFAYAKTKTQIS